jgi:hypothetical protein
MQYLTSLYGQFPTTPQGVMDLVEALKDYVGAVTARNSKILEYNACVNLIAQYQMNQQQIEGRRAALTDQVIEGLAADNVAMCAFISQGYYQARDNVLRLMDLTGRAYRFWALTDSDPFSQTFEGNTPPELNSTVLTVASNNFTEAYSTAVGNVGKGEPFPASDDESGLMYTISGQALDFFRKGTPLIVGLHDSYVTKSSTYKSNGTPFLGMSNIRISRVRAWVNGATTTSGRLLVTITHNGTENIVRADSTVFAFSHNPLTENFTYWTANNQIFQDTVFAVADTGSDELIAAVGPFTSWTITIDPKFNSGLDLSLVESVTLEFHGVSGAFT